MNPEEYQALDGLGLAALLRAGDVTPVEVMDCALKIADQVNPQINALCHMNPDMGRTLASKASLQGHFGALPLLLKIWASQRRGWPIPSGRGCSRGWRFLRMRP